MTNYMNAKQAWNKIIKELCNERNFCTVPNNSREPKWFSAKSIDNDKIFVYASTTKFPSCNITVPRHVNKTEFEKVYPLAIERYNGKDVVVNHTGNNSSYILGLIYEIIFKGDE